MLTLIAWRNIWRSTNRSLVVIAAVAIGLWAGLFMISFSLGMMEERARDQIERQISHIQIHDSSYVEDRDASRLIAKGKDVLFAVQGHPRILSATGRTLTMGAIKSPRNTIGVRINGVIPELEAEVTKLDTKLTLGEYFSGVKGAPILISERMAEKLKTRKGKKMNLALMDADSNSVEYSFYISGFFKTVETRFDDTQVFVQAADLQDMMGVGPSFHEIAALIAHKDSVGPVKADLQTSFPDLLVQDWKDISPELRLMTESMDAMMWIIMGIIIIALIFSIINTMLMAVMERTPELGMLMAVGMNKRRVFVMIMLETLLLTMVGVPLGLLLAWGTVAIFGETGIDMSAFSEGLEQFGMNSIIHPYLQPEFYFQVIILVFLAALFSAIFPALKALRLRPVEAIRSL